LCQLCRLNNALKKCFKVSNDGIIVSLTNKYIKLTFNCVTNTFEGFVIGIMMRSVSFLKEMIFNINHLYRLFGHCGKEALNILIKLYWFSSSLYLKVVRNIQLSRDKRDMCTTND
jgi:hypothetical protein